MAANQQSAHVKVGLLLTQVRAEFLRVSVSDPDGPAAAARALRRAFGLLQVCGSCYFPWGSAAGGGCKACYEGGRRRVLERSNVSGEEIVNLLSRTPHSLSIRLLNQNLAVRKLSCFVRAQQSAMKPSVLAVVRHRIPVLSASPAGAFILWRSETRWSDARVPQDVRIRVTPLTAGRRWMRWR